jgi:CRISPR-associated protein (TIGR02710 family)
LVADYTGGTKTMTSALVLAALDVGADLQVVTGTRADLVKVRDGTQEAAPAQVEAVRLEREMRPLLTAWRRFAYDEAAAGLESIPVPANARLRQLRHRALTLSRAFAAWDRFDHIEARRVLGDYGASLRPVFGSQLDALRILGHHDEVGHVRREGLRIWDLWLNARRRAAAGRYDDAVARAYRMIEWTAQWILESRNGWRTASLPSGIAQGAGIEANRDGVYQAGLYQAWALVAAHVPGPAAQFFEAQRLNILDHLQRRNASILAHGFEPVGNQDWRVFDNWLRDSFEPMLRAELKVTRIGAPFPQLPDAYPLIANHS